ncbi:hypothetical protein OH77DRAFT_1423296 [Trametes cingulata]|nr:hypothetical protein OH77DRAFT_1423296 [Trametes cingulata]
MRSVRATTVPNASNTVSALHLAPVAEAGDGSRRVTCRNMQSLHRQNSYDERPAWRGRAIGTFGRGIHGPLIVAWSPSVIFERGIQGRGSGHEDRDSCTAALQARDSE